MIGTRLAARLEKFPEYIFSRLAKEVAAVEKVSGRKILNLGQGSPDIPPSPVFIEKFAELIRGTDAHLYPGYRGIKEFNEALAAWYEERFGVALESDEILPLLGGKDGVAHLPLALADPGDEILVPDPGYPGFTGPALMVGVRPVPYDLSAANNFKISLDELKKKLTGRTKYVWVNFPSNPTGAVTTLDELQGIVAFAKENNITLVYDNAYSEITFDGYAAPSILQVPGARDVSVEIGSFSKTFSFAGYRMGWIVGNRDVIAALAKVKSQTDSGMALPLQRLGAFALTHVDTAWHEMMIATYKKRRDTIAEKLRSLGLAFELPKGSLYLWAKIPDSAADAESYCMDLLHRKQVLVAPGSAFGANGERYVRVSICANVSAIDSYL